MQPERSRRTSARTLLIVEAALAALGAIVFVLLAQAFVRGGEVVAVDHDVSRWAVDSVPAGVEQVARILTWLGSGVGTAVIAGTTVTVLLRRSRHVDAAFVGLAAVGITVLVAVLKAVYERARPDGGSAVRLPHTYSFPSGHAATAVVLYGALGLFAAERAHSRARAAVWLAAAATLALAIGASRVILNVHFVSDVAAGFAVGLAWLCCCLIARDALTSRSPGATQRFGTK